MRFGSTVSDVISSGGGHDEDVVALLPGRAFDRLDVHRPRRVLDRRHVPGDDLAAVQDPVQRYDDVARLDAAGRGLGQERQVGQPRVRVDDRDHRAVPRQLLLQPVGGLEPDGTAADDENAFGQLGVGLDLAGRRPCRPEPGGAGPPGRGAEVAKRDDRDDQAEHRTEHDGGDDRRRAGVQPLAEQHRCLPPIGPRRRV